MHPTQGIVIFGHIIGCVLLGLGLFHGLIKYIVIRDCARDLTNGGGVPTMDFVVIVPLWFSVGAAFLLSHYQLDPFPGFCFVLYLALAFLFYQLMNWEYRRGKPEIERQLKAVLDKKHHAEADAANKPGS